MNPFKEKEAQLEALLQQQLEQDGDSEAFTKALESLQVEFEGQLWRLGVAGEWEKQVGEKWVMDTPPAAAAPSQSAEPKTVAVPGADEEGDEEGEELEAQPPDDASGGPQKPEEPHPPQPGPDSTSDQQSAETGTGEETVEKDKPEYAKPVSPTDSDTDRLPAKTDADPLWQQPPFIIGGLIIVLLMCASLALAGSIFNGEEPTPTAVVRTESTPTAGAAAASTATQTSTPVPPTATETSTPSPTATPRPTDTATGVPTSTDTPQPTATATPVETPTDAATATSLPPSPTPEPVVQLPPTATPSPTPDVSGILAYPVFDSQRETYDIHVIDVATKQLLREIKNASQPDIRPGGKQIVYRSWKLDDRGLFVEDLHTGANGWPASSLHEAGRPIWKGDGSNIIYASNHINPQQWDFYFPQNVPEGSGGQTPAWFKDGRLIYQASSGSNSGLVVKGPGPPVFITNSPTDKAPAPSPDGTQVAFTSMRANQPDLYLVDVNSREVTRLTQDQALEASPIWSPDGQRIAFVSNRGGNWAIWTITPAGEAARILLRLPGSFDGKVKNVPDTNQTGWQLEHISWVNQEE